MAPYGNPGDPYSSWYTPPVTNPYAGADGGGPLTHGAQVEPGVPAAPIYPGSSTVPAAPTGPPQYNLSTDPGVILANHVAKMARTDAERAYRKRKRQMLATLAAHGILRSSERGYQTAEGQYAYGQQVAQINNAPLQAYIAAWQYARDHPELYSGISGIPAELGG